MFLGYKEKEAYWWEFVKMYLRITILVIYDLFVEQVRIKEILAGTILVYYCCWIFRKKPYRSDEETVAKKGEKKISSLKLML
jgi:hypothetical protein